MGTYDPMPADGATGWGTWLRTAISGIDARVLAYELGIPIIPSPQYPAVGDGNHSAASLATSGTDDAAIIQQALADAQTGAHAIFLARKTFRVNTTLDRSPDKSKRATSIIGIGSSNGSNVLGGGPVLLWGGTAGGTLLSNRVTGQNIPDGFLYGIGLRGYGSQCATLYEMGSTTTTSAKPDSGSEIEKVWFANCTGDAVVIDGDGVTMMDLNRVRFDAVGGYGIRVRCVSDTDIDISNVYYDNNNLPAGGTASGFLFFDGTSLGANAVVMLSGRAWKLEVQTDLTDANAAATDPADRRGLVRYELGTSGRMQFNMVVDRLRNSAASARTSYSIVLPTGGADADARRRAINLQGSMWRGMTGDGTAATGHQQAVGGIPTVDKHRALLGGANRGNIPNVNFSPGGGSVPDETVKDYTNTAYRARPTSQAIAAAVTSVTAIAHNMEIQPAAEDFRYVYTADPLAAGHCWASSVTSTTFTLNVKTAPGGAGTTLSWWFEND